MLSKLDQFKEDMGMQMFGRSRTVAMHNGQCVKCGEFNLEFKDEISRKEYGISGLCQCCQDIVFGSDE